MKALAICIALMTSAAASAQSISAQLNQRLGACSAQTDKVKRGACFEGLAKDAVAELDKQQAPQPTAPLAVEKPVSKYADLVAKAKANTTASFKDPASAQWRDLFISGKVLRALCGEVNAKNSYGAYIGYKRFISTDSPGLDFLEGSTRQPVFDVMWQRMCTEVVEKVE